MLQVIKSPVRRFLCVGLIVAHSATLNATQAICGNNNRLKGSCVL